MQGGTIAPAHCHTGRCRRAVGDPQVTDGNELILPLQTYLGGDGTVVTGLHASRVEISGSGADVYGNTGSMDIRLNFGSGSIVHDNGFDPIFGVTGIAGPTRPTGTSSRAGAITVSTACRAARRSRCSTPWAR